MVNIHNNHITIIFHIIHISSQSRQLTECICTVIDCSESRGFRWWKKRYKIKKNKKSIICDSDECQDFVLVDNILADSEKCWFLDSTHLLTSGHRVNYPDRNSVTFLQFAVHADK